MDKYEFLKLCSEYGGFPREMYLDYGESIIETYHRLIENGEITYFHGFFCLVSDKIKDNTYALVPYTGSYQELQQDSAFTEYHYWRAVAEKKHCTVCKKIYFASSEKDSCPHCKKELTNLLDEFVVQSKRILKDNLTGIYLHGSAVMGCFNHRKSDIDLLVVVQNDIPQEIKRLYMDMVVELNKRAPQKGIELSIVKECVCNPFVYPTPFELHFSIAHLDWYESNPEEYVEKMHGTDKDLAAHFTIIYHRGKTLYGKEITSVFAEVSREDYMDSIWFDIEDAKEEILENPMYITLNLCRVLAYKKENLILSKQEGGEWGLNHIAIPDYKIMISDALKEYQTGDTMSLNKSVALDFAKYMLEQIKDGLFDFCFGK